MFFDKCPSGFDSLILPRKDSKNDLLKVAKVIKLSLHTLYHSNLESMFK